MKVFVNPGHCPGADPGGCGHGLQEANVAAAVGALVKKYLDAAGVETMLFQANTLGEISATSNAWGSDLFVSIHCNSADNPAANGTETYRYPGSTKGAKLAGAIQAQLIDAIGTIYKKRIFPCFGIRTARLFWWKWHSSITPRTQNFCGTSKTILPAPLPEVLRITFPAALSSRLSKLLLHRKSIRQAGCCRSISPPTNLPVIVAGRAGTKCTHGSLSFLNSSGRIQGDCRCLSTAGIVAPLTMPR